MIPAEVLVAVAAGLTGFTAMLLLVMWSWRWRLLALALQYVGVFFLVDASWPAYLAATKVVAGWIAVIVLWLAASAQPETSPGRHQPAPGSQQRAVGVLPGAVLRFLAALMVIAAVFSIFPLTAEWLGGRDPLPVLGGLILLGLGLLHLGTSSRPFGICLGLLTVSSGFEVLYAIVETSAMVAGLQAAINLGLSLAISYIMLTPAEEAE